MDLLLINPDSSAKAYQGLSEVYSAIEPPTWSLLLAESCRSKRHQRDLCQSRHNALPLPKGAGQNCVLSVRYIAGPFSSKTIFQK